MITLSRSNFVVALGSQVPPAIEVEPGTLIEAEIDDWCFGKVNSDPATWSRSAQIPRCPAAGPIAVRGAEPGDALAVHILALELLGDIGHMVLRPGCGPLGGRFSELKIVGIPLKDGHALLPSGQRIPIEPMLGVMGTAPAGDPIPTLLSGDHGGNLDTREVKAGSTIWLPVNVSGGLLAFGDAHAAMGDGELSGSGVEIAVRALLRLDLVKAASIPRPRIVTPQAWVTLATHQDSAEAIRLVTGDMADWLVQGTGCTLDDAALLIGTAASLRFSHVINKTGPTIKLCLERRYVLEM